MPWRKAFAVTSHLATWKMSLDQKITGENEDGMIIIVTILWIWHSPCQHILGHSIRYLCKAKWLFEYWSPCSNISVRHILPWDGGEGDSDGTQGNKVVFLSGIVLHSIAQSAPRLSWTLEHELVPPPHHTEAPSMEKQVNFQHCWIFYSHHKCHREYTAQVPQNHWIFRVGSLNSLGKSTGICVSKPTFQPANNYEGIWYQYFGSFITVKFLSSFPLLLDFFFKVISFM